MRNRGGSLARWFSHIDHSFVKWTGPVGVLLGLLLAIGIGVPTGIDIYQNWRNVPPAERSQAGITLLQTVFTVVGGVAIFWNIVVSRHQLAATQEYNITDRFSKAVEQLGHSEVAVRMGGVYALGRIAQDSLRDYWSVMEILAVFVRDKKPLAHDIDTQPISYDRDAQAAIVVIGRRENNYKFSERAIYLNYADLRGMAFFEANYSNIRFHNSDLRQANFYRANLTASRFWKAQLEGTNFTESDLRNADMEAANLQGADLQGASLSNCRFTDANLHQANFTGVKGLTIAQVKAAQNWETALFDPQFSARLPEDTHE